MTVSKSNRLPLLMWLLPLSFFAYQFILRLWPSLMMDQIMHQFAIDATAFGFMASVYYYGYAGLQIPIALMLDRYNPRYVLFGCAVLCGVSSLVFHYTDNWYLALVSRFLIGCASAAGFLGTSKIVAMWFSREDFARMIGFTFTIGLMGAIYGGRPINSLIDAFGANAVALCLGIASFVIGFLILFYLQMPERVAGDDHEVRLTFHDFKRLMTSQRMWLLGIANLLLVGTLEGFADVWGVNYLMTAYGLTKNDAASLTSYIFIGMIFGGPILAFFSKHAGAYTIIALCGLGIMGAFIYLIDLDKSFFHFYTIAGLFVIVGILCCYQVMIFAAGSELVSKKMLGVTIAFLNSMNMLGGSFFHLAIGYLMDGFWQGGMNGDVRLYDLASYDKALLVIPVSAVFGVVIVAILGLRLHKRRQLQMI